MRPDHRTTGPPPVPNYAYQAVDGSGKRLRGNAQAVSTNALQRTLEERGLFVIDVAESAEAVGGRRGFRIGRRQGDFPGLGHYHRSAGRQHRGPDVPGRGKLDRHWD